MKRPFWMHQLVEYVLGVALVASGAQSPEPVVPAVLGGLLLLWAASTKGALAAFRLLPRWLHRAGDPFVAGALLVAAVQPWASVRVDSRFVLAGVAVVHLFVWWQSSYDEPVRAPRGRRAAGDAPAPAGDRATEIGRTAGRVVGTGVNVVRRARGRKGSV